MTPLDNWLNGTGSGILRNKNTFLKSGDDTDNLYLEMTCPGIIPESIKVNFFKGVLTINGVIAETKLTKQKEFERQIEVYEDIMSDAIDAEYKHGILFVTLPKSASTKAKTIKIKIN